MPKSEPMPRILRKRTSNTIHVKGSDKLIACSCRTPTRPTNVAAITGGVVGGVALAVILSAVMFIVIRRRFRQARLTFVGEDGLDGRDSIQPRRSEEDMPPPNYRRIFPSDAGAAEEHARAQSVPRVEARPRGIWRIGRKRPAEGISAPDQAASDPSTMLPGAVLDDGLAQAPVNRAILDASMWTWKGLFPPTQRIAVAGKKALPPVPGDVHEK
jgi:hypothetical protein